MPDLQSSFALPPDHAERFELAEEVHARPPEALATPSRAMYVAVLIEPSARAAEQACLADLCAGAGVAPPAAGASHFTADIGELRLKWERHGEFSSYAFFSAGRSLGPLPDPLAAQLPAGWLGRLPGRTLVAAQADLVPRPEESETGAAFSARCFGPGIVVGASVGGGAGQVFTDFRIHADGFSRFVVVDRSLTERQAGRVMQRLFEIEAYRMLALLALPLARGLSGRLVAMERALADGVGRIGGGSGGEDEAILQELTRLARDVESCIVSHQFRFGACAAYHELVSSRIAELREERLTGLQTIGEFMERRFSPAMATVASTARRLHELAERIAQGCTLLSTRVDIVRQQQNQSLLASMNRRARQQFRLQQTVEGLSVAAILYYAAGLIGYAVKAINASGTVQLQPDLAVGIALVPLAVAMVWTLRRLRRRAAQEDAERRPEP